VVALRKLALRQVAQRKNTVTERLDDKLVKESHLALLNS
jgi:hypothetical protein